MKNILRVLNDEIGSLLKDKKELESTLRNNSRVISELHQKISSLSEEKEVLMKEVERLKSSK